MSSVQFHCPLCDGLFQVDDELSGIEVNCPHCQSLVTVPDFAAPPLPPPESDAFELNCPLCDGPFQVTADMSGQEVSCPHCQETVVVPSLNGDNASFAAPTELFPPGFVPSPADSLLPPGFESPQPMLPPQHLPPMGTALPPPSPVRTAPVPTAPVPTAPAQELLYPPGHAPSDRSSRKSEREPQRGSPTNRPLPAVDPMLPPGAKSPSRSDARREVAPANDPMLPPESGGASTRRDDRDELLPQAAASTATSAERMPLPAAIPNRSNKDAVLIPTEHGYIGVRAPVKTVRHHGQEVELRQLTPEEKGRRRAVRNTILILFCVFTLVAVMAAFMWNK